MTGFSSTGTITFRGGVSHIADDGEQRTKPMRKMVLARPM